MVREQRSARSVSASRRFLTQRATERHGARSRARRTGCRRRRGAAPHEVRAPGDELAGVLARRGPQAPAHPVAHDGATDAAPDGVRDARRLRARPDDRGRRPSRHPDDGAGPEPARETSTAHEPAKSGRQAGAALGPAASQHPAPGLRPHPQAEAVLLAPLAIVRLERPLHAWPPRTPEPQPDGAPGARRATATLRSAMSQRHTAATGAGTAREQRQSVRLRAADPARQSRPVTGRTRGRLLRCPQR